MVFFCLLNQDFIESLWWFRSAVKGLLACSCFVVDTSNLHLCLEQTGVLLGQTILFRRSAESELEAHRPKFFFFFFIGCAFILPFFRMSESFLCVLNDLILNGI